MSTRNYGVDVARSSYLPWCKCGWRELASGHDVARQVLADHRSRVHDDKVSEVLKDRRKAVTA